MKKIMFSALLLFSMIANSVTITTTSNIIASNDGQCDIVDAINAANNDIANDCPAGNGLDVIVITSDVNITSSTNLNALPIISSDMVIRSSNPNIFEIRRDSLESFRIFQVSSTGNLTLSNIRVSNGRLLDDGGCILNNGSLRLSRAFISECDSLSGYAVYSSASSDTDVVNSRILSNNSGGIFSLSTMLIDKSSITNNFGDGVHSSGRLRVYNSTISTNNNDGIQHTGSQQSSIINSTIAFNNVGINLAGGSPINQNVFNFSNSIISNNDFNCIQSGNSVYNFNTSLVDDNTCSGATVSSSINLMPLVSSSHALISSSSAVNEGSNAVCSSSAIGNKDQRNLNRPESGGSFCDIGSYELQTLSLFPSIELTKVGVFNDENNDGLAQVNETITYLFEIENDGDFNLFNISIDDPLITVSGSLLNLPIGSIDTASFSGNYFITQNDIDNGLIENTASVNATDSTNNPVTDTSSHTINLPILSSLSLVKAGVFNDENADGIAQVGETITYRFTVENTGNTELTDVVIDDPLVNVNGIISSLSPGQIDTSTFSATYTIDSIDVFEGEISNTATVEGLDPFDNLVQATSNNGIALIIDLPGVIDIDLQKFGSFNDENNDGIAQVGETISYSFRVENTGSLPLFSVFVNDPLFLVSGGTRLTAGEIDTTTFSGTYTINQTDVHNGFVSNIAEVEARDSNDNIVTDQSNNGVPLITLLPGVGSLELVKSGVFNDENNDGIAQLGESIAYNFTVTNNGTLIVNNIQITDPLVSVSGTLPMLIPGASDSSTFSANYILTQSDLNNGFVSNIAIANGLDAINNPVSAQSNNNNPLITNLPSAAAISLTKSAQFVDENNDGIAQVGESIAYSFVVTNTGTTTLNTLTIDDALVSVPGTLVMLAPGTADSSTFSANYVLTQSDIDTGSVSNIATVNAFDPNNNSVSAQSNAGTNLITNLPVSSSMTLMKSAQLIDTNNDGIAQVGETIEYSFVVTNTGNTTLSAVSITDPLVSVPGSLGMLAPGASNGSTFSATYVLTQSDIDAGSVSNVATANAVDSSNNPVSAQSNSGTSVVTNLPVSSSIGLIKEAQFVDANNDGLAQVGETIVYSFTVSNTGTTTLNTISIDDDLVSVPGLLASLASGGSDASTFSATYVITQNDIDQGSVSNDAVVNAFDPGNNPVSAQSNGGVTLVTALPTSSGVMITKSGIFVDTNNDGIAQVGETVSYTFEVLNIGNTTLNTLTITDVLVNVPGTLAMLAPAAIDNTTFSASYSLVQADIDDGFVSNIADVNGFDPFNNPVTAQSNAGVPVIINLPSSSTLSLTKLGQFIDTNNDGLAQVGETIQYNFVLANNGTTTLNTLTLDDPIVSVPGTLSTLAPGAIDNSTFGASYFLTQNDIDTGSVNNDAVANAFDPSNNPVSALSNAGVSLVTALPVSSAVSLTKDAQFIDSNNDGLAQAGETILYSFVVTNTGTTTLNTLSIDDALVNVPSTLAMLAPGAADSATFSASYVLIQSDINNGSVSNIATVNAFDPSNNVVSAQSNAGANLITNLPVSSSITLMKSAQLIDTNNDGLVQVGETIEYSFVVANTGNTTLSAISIIDPLVNVPGSLVMLAPGTSDDSTFSAIYVLTQADIDAGTVTNLATVNAVDPSNNPVSAQSNSGVSVVTNLPVSSSIDLIKTAQFVDNNNDGLAQVGETIVYGFSVTNTGNTTLNTISIDDPLISVPGLLASLVSGGSDASTFSATYVITQNDIDQGSVSNDAIVNAFDPGNNPVSAQSNGGVTLVTTLPFESSINLIKSAEFIDSNNDGLAQVGETIAYSFTVENTGNTTLSAINIDDPIVSVPGTLATLAAGDSDDSTFSVSYVLTQSDIDSGNVSNVATVNAIDPSNNMVNAQSNAGNALVTNLPSEADINLLKEGEFNDENSDGYAQVGETISYTFTVENIGLLTLSNITITDNLINVDGLLGTLEPGATDDSTFSADYAITQDDINTGSVSNIATVNAFDPSNNTVSGVSNEGIAVIIDLPSVSSMSLVKEGSFTDLNNDGFAQAGETIEYQFTVSNTGSTVLSSVTMDDELVAVDGVIESLAAGETDSSTFIASYVLTQNDIDFASVSNIATANAFDPSNNQVSAESNSGTQLIIDLPVQSSIELTKQGQFNDLNQDGFAQVNETITYSFEVKNTGSTTLSNININDDLISVDGKLATLAAGVTDDSTFAAEYVITQEDIDFGKVSNIATVSANDPENNLVTAQSNSGNEVITELPVLSSIKLTKSGEFVDTNNDGYAQAGELLRYDFIVENSGSSTLFDIHIDDHLVNVNGQLELLVSGDTDNTTFSAVYHLTTEDIAFGKVSNIATVHAIDSSNNAVSAQSNNGEPFDIELVVLMEPILIPTLNIFGIMIMLVIVILFAHLINKRSINN